MPKIRFLMALTPLLTILFLLTSCQTDNSAKTIFDLLRHFKKHGLVVKTFSPLVPDTIKASNAVKMKIGNREIGVYKYDITKKKPLKKLNRIKDLGYVYIIGRKYPTVTNGCFILLDFDAHPEKDRIVEVFESF